MIKMMGTNGWFYINLFSICCKNVRYEPDLEGSFTFITKAFFALLKAFLKSHF